MLTLIDNYDSFTYNLVHFLGELGASTQVYRNDKVTVDEVLAEGPEAIVCRSSAFASVIRPSVKSMAAA
jgi:anthranilate synthase component 2